MYSSLAPSPGLQLRFHFQLKMQIGHYGLLLRLTRRTWVCPIRARCGGGAPAWVAWILAAPVTQAELVARTE